MVFQFLIWSAYDTPNDFGYWPDVILQLTRPVIKAKENKLMVPIQQLPLTFVPKYEFEYIVRTTYHVTEPQSIFDHFVFGAKC